MSQLNSWSPRRTLLSPMFNCYLLWALALWLACPPVVIDAVSQSFKSLPAHHHSSLPPQYNNQLIKQQETSGDIDRLQEDYLRHIDDDTDGSSQPSSLAAIKTTHLKVMGPNQQAYDGPSKPKASLNLLASKYTKLGNATLSKFPIGQQQQQHETNGLHQHHQNPQHFHQHHSASKPQPLTEASRYSQQVIEEHHHPHDGHQAISGQPQRAVGLLDKICIGTSNKLTVQHNKSDHYQNLVERYSNCTYVIGNLEITWLDRSSSSAGAGGDVEEPLDLSFLESIREITGYLLIAYVDVDTIRMPNLQIIRGRDLYADEKEEFALILISNELRQLELPNLREILSGSVGSFNNRNLCHIRHIEWSEILNWPAYRTVLTYNGTVPIECPCDASCQGPCWSDGPDMCQKFSKTTCSPQCGSAGRCFGPNQNECCHSYCAGGCTGPNQTDCLACKNFYDDGSCIQECPLWQRYNPSKFLWEPNPNGKYAFGATCVKECPEHMLRDSGACVRVCPPNKRSHRGECVTCGGPCPKNCQGVELVHSGNINQLINCTVIEGSLTILDESFTGFSEPLPPTSANITTQPTQQNASLQAAAAASNQSSPAMIFHKPMEPSQLEVFKTLREITGYLRIEARHPDFKNLSYFSNLRTIQGRQSTDMFHALSITRTSLVSLNLRSLRQVLAGKVLIEENPELCFADTIDWSRIDDLPLHPHHHHRPRDDFTIRNNAEADRCRSQRLQCHEQCARDGCWGPGPDECLSCTNYKVDDYCVINCNHTQSLGFLSFEDPSARRTCKRCHPECRLGCSGVEARHCHQCKNVKDGPYCVPECPSHKYNNHEGVCEECDKSCADGCTGPSNRLGPGGCNACAKAIIRSADVKNFDVTCIQANESCPDGFYQEYVLASSLTDEPNHPFRSSAGRPVCRKCHHRCKKCIGMGTHKSVCECAKYLAGEQCEDSCPAREYYPDEESRTCLKCSPECNGCTGPTEADCISCRVYRIYYEVNSNGGGGQPFASAQVGYPSGNQLQESSGSSSKQQVRFNCTAQCPSDKPHRISESNMLDPYCSEDPGGIDLEGPLIYSLFGSSTAGSILLLLVILTAVMLCMSIYRCQLEKDKTVKLTMHLSGIDDVEPLSPSHLKPNLGALRSIKETELRKGKVLGSGFGGTVYQGFWYPDEGHSDTSTTGRSGAMPVAIKVLRDNGQSNMNKEFLDEAYVMASVKNANLVPLLAVCMTPNHLMLVTQLMPLGCLLDYVQKNRHDIGSKNLLEWGKQIACGMAYLEERRLVHRDLALRNVLLQTSGRARISDFGLAKFLELDQSEYHSGGGRLPIKWLAPECFMERKFTHKSDVWAFGVTIWELVTFGRRPFEEYETREVPMAIEKGARLQQPNYVTAEVYKVMIACWFYNPDDRPNFKTLVKEFAKFARDPERYLICGPSKGLEATALIDSKSSGYFFDCADGFSSGVSDVDDDDDGIEDDIDEDEMDDDEGLDVDVDDDDDGENLSSPAASSQPPLSAMPDLTPSTHNRINENMFGFELTHPQQHHSGQRVASESEHLATPLSLKKMTTRDRSMDDVMLGHQAQHNTTTVGRRRNRHHLAPIKTRSSSTSAGGPMIQLTTDANNNTLMVHSANNNTSCWSVQRSDQPTTDMYDYLLPSPHPNVNAHTSSTFCSAANYASDVEDKTITVSHIGQPPHSAGLAANGLVTNEEYFLSRPINYVNQQVVAGGHGEPIHHRLSNSNGNMPYSIV